MFILSNLTYHAFYDILLYLSPQFVGKQDYLVSVTPYLSLFNTLRLNKKLPSRVRAIDMRHILLFLPFLEVLDGLLAGVVFGHNMAHPLHPVLDPSSEHNGITLLFIQWYGWYRLYRRRYPPKDEVDIQTLTTFGESKSINCCIMISAYYAYTIVIGRIFILCILQVFKTISGRIPLQKRKRPPLYGRWKES